LKRDFRRQPWQQLARALVDIGHEDDAKLVRIEMRKRLRRSRWFYQHPWWRWPWSYLRTRLDWLLGLMVGYGYRPWRIAWALLVLWLVGVAIYASAASAGLMVPLDAKVARSKTVPPECKVNWVTFSGPQLPRSREVNRAPESARHVMIERVNADATRRGIEANRLGLPIPTTWHAICRQALPPEYSEFDPWLYSADVLVPFLDARQKAFWRPRSLHDDTVSLPPRTKVAWRDVTTVQALGFVRVWQWVETIAGWAFLLLIGGTVSGLIRRE
jgi:hypothetical protein